MPSIRVEPTQKLTNDEVFGRASTAPAGGPPARAASPPPAAQVIPPRPLASAGASASLSAIPGRRWGLIVVVLVLDLGLAIAGAVMIKQALEQPAPARRATPTRPTASANPAPPPPATAATAAAPTAPPVVAAGSGDNAGSASPVTAPPAEPRNPARKPTRNRKVVAPIDPYGDPK